MPKVDLHRHLEGSIRLNTLLDIAIEYNIALPSYEAEVLRPYVQMMPDDPPNFGHFLSKFGMLRRFYRSPEIVQRITREAVLDAAADNVRYLELRFTPYALVSRMHYTMTEVLSWVCGAAQSAAAESGIAVGLIVSMNRHERIELGLQAFNEALAFKDQGVVGLDLAGQETGFPARPFGPFFLEAKQEGLGITVHAGEWHGPENVYDAILHMFADRIGHGVRVVENSDVVQLARERGIVFEVCPTSNLQTGSVANIRFHPLIDLHYLDLAVTINTDDPAISGITLTDEYVLATDRIGLTVNDVRKHVMTAAESAFLPPAQKATMVEALRRKLDEYFTKNGLAASGTPGE